MSDNDKCACVILNFNDAENTLQLVRKIRKYKNLDYIVLVDNCSTDGSLQRLCEHVCNKIIVIACEKNGGYGAGNNYGVLYCKRKLGCRLVLIANPDVIFTEKDVENFKKAFDKFSDCGIVSGIQMNLLGEIIGQSAWKIPSVWRYIISTEFILRKWGNNFFYPLEFLYNDEYVQVDCVAGALLMVSAEAFVECGGYDEEMFLFYEETALGCKMKNKGYSTYICSLVQYHHLHGASINKSIKSIVRQKSIFLHSHHLALKRYLGANRIECCADQIVIYISMLETILKSAYIKIKRKVQNKS